MGLSRTEAPYVSVPLNCVLQLVPSAFACEEKVTLLNYDTILHDTRLCSMSINVVMFLLVITSHVLYSFLSSPLLSFATLSSPPFILLRSPSFHVFLLPFHSFLFLHAPIPRREESWVDLLLSYYCEEKRVGLIYCYHY